MLERELHSLRIVCMRAHGVVSAPIMCAVVLNVLDTCKVQLFALSGRGFFKRA